MDLISIIGVTVIGAVITLFLKQYRPELSILISIAISIFVLFCCVGYIVPIFSQIKKMVSNLNINTQNIEVLLKSIGICYLAQFASEICRDAGQTSISTKVELVGKILVCAAALPLFKNLIDVIQSLIGKAI